MRIKIKDILISSKDVKFVGNIRNIEKIVSFYSLDSREIKGSNINDSLYFAYKGNKVDGFSFVKYLIDLGVKCFVCSRNHESECIEYLNNNEELVFLLTSDVIKLLQTLASFLIKRTSFKRIAITGSNGKTTTKEMLYSILSKKYKTYKTWGNLNSDIGLPLSILRVEGNEEYAVFEVGISYVGEMDLLSQILKPEIVIITNISYAHMQAFKEIQAIAFEKSKIIGKNIEIFVVNEMNDYCVYLEKRAKIENPNVEIVYFDFENLNIKSFSFLEGKFSYDFVYKGFEYSILLLGRHNIFNAIGCINLALFLGMREKEIREGLVETDFQKGRAEILTRNGYLILNDSYNGNMGSFMALKNMILDLNIQNRKFIVLGSFKELGEFTYKAHKDLIQEAVLMNFDKIFLIGEEFLDVRDSENLVEKCLYYFNEFDKFIEFFLKSLEPSVFIVIKGSRFNRLERILNYI
ncbi:UDP-N-acetylmuramoyl-tripeptide--D-alanyl-D-alanine ligase [Borreliella chilensis]|uniref:UDP-N-acetylmuramoyl-tripeptide--D-alanyl-D-alanine ligase n=1 Tax=Borreliella chilensis TaxID=1245910 RepID=A0A0A7V1Q6_9SPIR|nr:UDP-N-acetylmuramoyl-tripeptide--D-alanyl-D-alanine ligase [Borreliella chilensis]